MTPESCHIYIAIDRKRDNPNNTNKIAIRQIISNPETDIEIIKHKCKLLHPDKTFRIYRTVNKRSYAKAFKQFQHRLIEDPNITKIDSLWKTCLLNPKSKAERKFLIDIDSKTEYNPVEEWLKYHNIIIYESSFTPNGYHLITDPFDSREFNFPNTEIKKDALLFIRMA